MTTAYWMILVAGLLPYWPTVVSKWRRDYDNATPRAGIDRLPPANQRAYWAQLNAFEAFPLFAAAVIIAHLAQAAQVRVDALAVAFVGCRIVYTLAYIYDRPTLRSLVWSGALLCVIGLFVVAA
ncbi:MAG: hypothetical protein EHM16_14930 [Betaproteobacteria bacterium]|nr:MAG: hypothetical protein EHM16_14930 [Betaproteobacteria bacterium]